MTLTLRSYQERAVLAVFAAWQEGHRRVCLVMPTGAGKTAVASFIAKVGHGQGLRVAFVTHTVDLLAQSTKRVPHAHVVTVQSGRCPPADILILDECHHFVADEWAKLLDAYPEAMVVGLTATPERADGRPLDGMFSKLVVGAEYSELLRLGVLVPCRVLRPASELERGVAKDPVEAYRLHGESRAGFVYVRTIAEAGQVADRFRRDGVSAGVVSADTPPGERELLIAQMRDGSIRLLVNVYALTEGVDVPHASVAILARNFGHVSALLQTAGRILRAAPGKKDALLIDLPGVTHKHGVPTEDREYSLEGVGIRRKAGGSLRVCMKCGTTWPGDGACPRCGFSNPTSSAKPQRVYDVELIEAQAQPAWQKKAEYERLRDVARAKGLTDSFINAEYKRKYGEEPAWLKSSPDMDRKRKELDRFVSLAKQKGYDMGWAKHRYKALYGSFPPRGWI